MGWLVWRLQYGDRRSPYRKLLSQRGSQSHYWLRQVLCNPLSITQTAKALKLEVSEVELEILERDLEHELSTVTLFPEA